MQSFDRHLGLLHIAGLSGVAARYHPATTNERALNKCLRQEGTESIFITPGSPWENAKCESFNGKLRDECLNAHWFRTLKEAKVLIEMWRKQYNSFRPHRSLGSATPLEFASHWNATHPSDSLPIVV